MEKLVISNIGSFTPIDTTDLLQEQLYKLNIIGPQPVTSQFMYYKQAKPYLVLSTMTPELTRSAPLLQDMFTDTESCHFTNQEFGLLLRVNALCNRVATKTRRAIANKIILGEKLGTELIKQREKHPARFLYDVTLSDLVPENEIWATYARVLRVNVETGHRVIDGGAYVDTEGLKLNPNWRSYFLKMTIHD